MSETQQPGLSPELRSTLIDHVPFAKELGIELTAIQPGDVSAVVAYRDELVGDPESGIVHGGVVTALLDNLCGVAVQSSLETPLAIATLDLRIDYMKPAKPGLDILARCECYHKTNRIAFVRGVAHTGDPDKPVAHCTGTFMLASSDAVPTHTEMYHAAKKSQPKSGQEAK
ncbi:MAG: PaaI family thioesterase [Alphaproteobacteria bacterium]